MIASTPLLFEWWDAFSTDGEADEWLSHLLLVSAFSWRNPSRWLRETYYRWGYGSSAWWARFLAKLVGRWEARHQTADVPISSREWDEQYRAGRWSFLHQLDEVPHYGAIAALHHHLNPGGAILDVGCGEGLFFRTAQPFGYREFVGIDTSAAAISALAPAVDARTRFLVHDAESYQPEGKFDTVVFCESLYYFHDPLAALRRYAAACTPQGVIIVSIWQGSPRSRAILAQIRRELDIVAGYRLSNEKAAWEICIIRPAPAVN